MEELQEGKNTEFLKFEEEIYLPVKEIKEEFVVQDMNPSDDNSDN